MKTDIELVKQRLYDVAKDQIIRDFKLHRNRISDPDSLALELIDALKQTPVSTPLAVYFSNEKVFETAVRAIGSNMRNWISFLKNYGKLRAVLHNFDYSLVVSRNVSPSSIAPLIKGQTMNKDAQAIIEWAKLLVGHPNFYDNVIKKLGSAIKSYALKSFKINLSNSELMLCIWGLFTNPSSSNHPIFSTYGLTHVKLPRMGMALGSEFLRNLGWDGFKIDNHVGRLLKHWISSPITAIQSRANDLCNIIINTSSYNYIYYSLLAIHLSPSGLPYNYVDNLIWALGKYVEKKGKESSLPYIKPSIPYLKSLSHMHFPNSTIINLGSKYNWEIDIENILSNVNLWNRSHFNDISLSDSMKRLSEIRYFCTIDKLTMQETRILFSNCEDEYSEEIADWFDDAPEKDDKSEEFDERDEFGPILPDEFDSEKDDSEVDETKPEEDAIEPHEETANEEPIRCREGEVIQVIVDCYGIYVRSFYSWLKRLKEKNDSLGNVNPEIKKWYDKISQDPSLDGPAVLLCPENIVTIIPTILKRKKGCQNDFIMKLSHKVFLKIVLLHEVGHHFFPITSHNETISEGFAQWYAFKKLNYYERKALFEMSKTQRKDYQAYQGIAGLCHPQIFEEWFLCLLPSIDTIWFIEHLAFNDDLNSYTCHNIALYHLLISKITTAKHKHTLKIHKLHDAVIKAFSFLQALCKKKIQFLHIIDTLKTSNPNYVQSKKKQCRLYDMLWQKI